MEYRLYIQTLSGTWKLADMGADLPAMTFQINDIAEMKNRQADYSQALKLPRSGNNCAIFGYMNDPDVDTPIPYRRLNCRLLYGESMIAGYGSYIVLDKVSEYFETQVLSGNADFFDILSKNTVASINLGYVQRYVTAVGLTPNDDGFYCIAEFSKQSFANYTFNENGYMFLKRSYPFTNLHKLIEKLCSQNGYTLISNITNKDILLKINFETGDENSFLPLNGETLDYSGTLNLSAGESKSLSFNSNIPFSEGLNPSFDYLARDDVKFDYHSNVTVHSTTGKPYTINVKINGVTVYTSYQESGQDWTSDSISNAVVNGGEHFKFEIEVTAILTLPNTLTYTTHFKIYNVSFQDETNASVPNGGLIPIAKNTGFEYQIDLFKLFCQAYGLTVYVDNELKKVYCFTMQKLYDNIPLAVDWTNKLSKNNLERSFVISGYAKENRILFQESDIFNSQNTGSFNIDDDTLEETKDLFTLEAGTTEDIPHDILGDMVKIPLVEMDDDGVLSFDFDKVYIAKLSQATHEVSAGYDYDLAENSYRSDLHFALTIQAQELIDVNYDKLVNGMLNKSRYLDAEFYLLPEDIDNYKKVVDDTPGAFIPVYVDGAFYYINKIKNFVSGKLTKCELVRL